MELAEIEESKKRQKEDHTPASMSRQSKNQRGNEKKEKETEKDDHIQKELFPASSASTYMTFYSKEHKRGKEPRWKQQLASVEERNMQASTPHTAKKQGPNTDEAKILSKQLDEQMQEAKRIMTTMQDSMGSSAQQPFVQEIQQQVMNLQQSVQQLEKYTDDLRAEIKDVDILTQHVHQSLHTQQQREAAKQTVAKGWPQHLTDEERNRVIHWYMEKAGVANQYSTSNGRYMHGKYKRSPITIIHWKEEWAKHSFETYIYKRFNKHYPVTIWDKDDNTIYYGTQPHRISFVPQTSDMEREINLTIQAALHIVTKHEQSDLANSWNKVAVKWQDKLAIRISDNAVIFKLIKDKEDSKYMYLNIHKDYFDVINDNWKAGWSEANSKTKCPDYNKYTYILKFATLRSNEEYYTLRAARWGDPQEADVNMQDN